MKSNRRNKRRQKNKLFQVNWEGKERVKRKRRVRTICIEEKRNAIKVKRWTNRTSVRNKRVDWHDWSWKTSVEDWRDEMKTWVVDEAEWGEVEVDQRKVHSEIIVCFLSVPEILKLVLNKVNWKRRTFESTSRWDRS